MNLRLASLFVFFGFAALAQADIQYSIEPEPTSRDLLVTISADLHVGRATFQMPEWAPGFYTVLGFGQKVFDFSAKAADGTHLTFDHPNRYTWEVNDPGGQAVRVSYRVSGDDAGLGFFGTHVDDRTAFMNGPSALMYAVGHKDDATTLDVRVPTGWGVATPMDPGSVANRFVAENYDELVDNPVQMGSFETRTFTSHGIPFEVVVVSPTGGIRADLDEQTKIVEQAVGPAIDMMGGAPFHRYVCFFHLAVGDFSGGLEHRSCNVQALPNATNFAGPVLTTHEYFHAWNVKQIRPIGLGPFDYTQPVRTVNLWFAEGVTDYYAEIHAFRAGLISEDEMISDFNDALSELDTSVNQTKYSLETASQAIWDFGGISVGDFSYYTKGKLVALVLDAAIRDATNGQKSLDDVMRVLYQRHRLPHPGYAEDELPKVMSEVAGKDLSALYDKLVRRTEKLPYDVLQNIGLHVNLTSVKRQDVPFMCDPSNKVTFVLGEAERAGLREGDEVLDINGADPGSLNKDGLTGPLKLTIKRESTTKSVVVPLHTSILVTYQLEKDPKASADHQKQMLLWLGNKQGSQEH